MDKIRKPDNTASFLVNDNIVELVAGESFSGFPYLVVDSMNEYYIQYSDTTIKKRQEVRIKNYGKELEIIWPNAGLKEKELYTKKLF